MNYVISEVLRRIQEKSGGKVDFKDITVGEVINELKKCLETKVFVGSYYDLSESALNLFLSLGGRL